MKTLKNWRLEHHDDTTVQLRVHDRHLICINILDNKLFRVRLLKDGAWRLNRSWTVNPDGNTLPKVQLSPVQAWVVGWAVADRDRCLTAHRLSATAF